MQCNAMQCNAMQCNAIFVLFRHPCDPGGNGEFLNAEITRKQVTNILHFFTNYVDCVKTHLIYHTIIQPSIDKTV